MNANRALIVMTVASLLVSGCFGSSPSTTPSSERSASPTASAPPTISSPAPSPTEYATAVPTATPTTEPAASPTPPPTAAPTPSPTAFITYTVRAGDTLGSIAAAYRTTWASLVYWNRTRYATLDPDSSSYDPNSLTIGWALRLQPGEVVAYDAPIPVTPTAAPTLAPTVAPAPAAGILVTNGARGTNRVALTLDMGGRVGDAVAIMTWLRDHDVRATIFMTGSMADSTVTDAGRQVLARVDARPDLFDLGNHSYSHPHMTTLTVAQMRAELTSTEAAVDRYAASSPRPFFRPPYGEWNTTLVDAAASAGYPYSVMWDVDTIDWKPVADGGPTAQAIVDKVRARAQGGSIVLMHLGGYETLDALPGIVAGLRDRGFEFVTLGQMLGG